MADEGISQAAVRRIVSEKEIKKYIKTKVVEIGKGNIRCKGPAGEFILEADSIVCALGLSARSRVAEELSGICEKTFVIGDCNGARKIFNCTQEAWAAVYGLD